MTLSTYSDLFLTFEANASGGGITTTSLNNLIINLLRQYTVAVAGDSGDYTTYNDNENVQSFVISRASDIANNWHNRRENIEGAITPTFSLSKDDIQFITNGKKWTFRFASREDEPLNEIGDGN